METRPRFSVWIVALILIVALAGACSSAPTPTERPPSLQSTATPVVALPSPGPGGSATSAPAPQVPAVAADLVGLDFDAFLERSYNTLLMRNPEAVTQLGLSDVFGMGNDQLTDISDAYIRETQALEAAILGLLQTYDREQLTPEQQLSADIYGWWLEDEVAGQRWMYYTYPVSQFITAVHQDLLQLFTDIQPLTDRQDAEDYIARLSQVDTKLEQLLDGLQRRDELGVIPPRFIVQWALRDLLGIAGASPRRSPFYTAFAEKVEALPGLSQADKTALLDAAAAEVEATVLPAFQALVDYVRQLETRATDDDGVWRLPDGEAYYAYALRHHTTTGLTADQIHELGLQEVARIQAEVRAVCDGLGYPAGESLPALIGRVAKDGGTLYGDDIVAEYEALIAEASEKVQVAFDLRPKADVIVIPVPQGGYYIEPALDGTRPGAFYATMTGSEDKFSMPSLAYHEAVPGHHTQIGIAQELDLPSARKGVHFTAYSEGWALYAERLAYELGFYADDPYGDVGRLQYELFRAVRLVVDTGLHARRWTFRQAVDYMVENTGLPQQMVEWEVARYIVWPGQAVSYKIGMLKLLEVRQRAMDALGDRFDLTEFHNLVLGNGHVPLEILERLVDEWIAQKGE